jgi:hypothetical protein
LVLQDTTTLCSGKPDIRAAVLFRPCIWLLHISKSEENTFVHGVYRDTAFDFHSHSKRTISLRLLVFVIIAAFACSCNSNQKFDKTAWQQRGDLGLYPEREKMLKDLMNNYQLKRLTFKKVIELLGEREKYSDEEPNTVTYNIVTGYGPDIDPVYIKNLEVKFSSDSIVADIHVNEIKH